MATYGAYSGAIKATFDDVTQVAANGSNIDVDPAVGLGLDPKSGAKYIVCVITTTGAVRIQIGESATATSFPLTASDDLICTVASDRVLGVWGNGGTPTVTIKRLVV